MFFNKILVVVVAISLIVGCSVNKMDTVSKLAKSNISFSEKQLSAALSELNNSSINPGYVVDGKLHQVQASSWVSGFFPGNLWQLYEITRDGKWREAAHHYSMNIEEEKYNTGTHDMGFKLYCSFGNGYRLTQDSTYKSILLEGAKSLSTRYNPKIGCIRSWDHNADKWDFPVIIDNMLNLELLFWATHETNDSSFYKIAVSHAMKTLENHFRNDYSSYHVVSFDTITGEVAKKNTHQGYSHESAWSRGQGWGIYGFTMVYRETGNKIFLQQAENIANFILNHPNLPEDGIPYWDFNDPKIPNSPRDASAGAIICSALYELSMYVEGDDKKRYFDAADKILESLSSPKYRAVQAENSNFLLMHSVGNMPKNAEIDVPIIYADYYFLEANIRRIKLTDN